MHTFYPRLDGLRAFAVFAVMVFHWAQPTVAGRPLPLGFMGVELFFVLSGFLIGGILLRAQEQNESDGTPQLFTLQRFVIRRALRIFPAYFVYLLVTALTLGVPDDEWWWYPTYLSNYRLSVTPEWPGHWSHTWSLAVEEQFYLIAPLIILLLSRSAVRIVIPALTLACGTFILATPSLVGMSLIAPKAFFGLLLGVTLAMFADVLRKSEAMYVVGGSIMAAFCLFAFVLEWHDGRIFTVAAPVVFAAIVLAATGTSRRGQFLEWAPLAHIGRLAYGLYLWHLAAPMVWERLGLPVPQNGWALVACFSIATYALARLSWRWVEHPVNRLKDRYQYHPSAAVPVGNNVTGVQTADRTA